MNKTKPTPQPGSDYLSAIENEARRADATELTELMQQATKQPPAMWGSSIIGFGVHHYEYESGRVGDTVAVGFAARKQALALYGLFQSEQDPANSALAGQLGPHTHAKGCLYIKKLSDVNPEILKQMIAIAYKSRSNTH